MHALVTGGAGFIGSTLVDRLLEAGHPVDVIDNLSTGSLNNLERANSHTATFRFHRADLLDPCLLDLVVTIAPDVVFHLAAQASVAVSVAEPGLDAAINVLGTVRILEAASAAGAAKLVFAASGGTLYGDVDAIELPVREDHARGPTSPYGIAKAVALDYLEFFRTSRGLDYTALALANVYGPRQDSHGEAGVAAIFAANIIEGRPSEIHGDGEQTRDFVYVDDVVDAFERAAQAGSGRLLNIGTGTQLSVRALYGALSAANGGAPAPVPGPKREGDVRCSALWPELARAELGWVPTTPLAKGLKAVLAYAQGHLETPSPVPDRSGGCATELVRH